MNSDPRITCDPASSPPIALQEKASLRKALLATRRALPEAVRRQWDAAIAQRLLAWCATENIAELAVYWPLHGEPDLHAAYAELNTRGVALSLPVVLEKHAPLAFTSWTPGELMVKDGMGVAVPAELRLRTAPATLLVPCLGFNPERYRLGYGGGYYDRTLEQAPRPRTLGIAYGCLQAQFASGPYDIALDHIVTEGDLL
ncbi:5-formyltetrahydrofolate cyclo-ligase [Janthinobacterium sp. J1-1]|uniref:5-formyltetrahydrofolate cyclo-ligase n=1 Tax=unclassified Janthinobacterium TaxID=2610881 RepID=UPI002810D7DA|nr:5-formyltetrahydrofolate cyclo-ligase [Janthinobacterium sp. J1-1]